MILGKFDYEAPGSLAEAISALARHPASRAIAGGRGLLTELKHGECKVERLIDLQRIVGLRGVAQLSDGRLRVGAMTTLAELFFDATIREHHIPGVLGDAIPAIEDPQGRNRSTVGGTLAAGRRGSDLAAVLLALAASVNCIGPRGQRTVAIDDLFISAGTTCPLPSELITSVDLPLPEPGSAYEKVADPATLDAICGVAVTVALTDDGNLARCRIAVVGATEYPRRLAAVEEMLIGSQMPLTVPSLSELDSSDSIIDDHTASRVYRVHLIRTLAARAFARAIARVGIKDEQCQLPEGGSPNDE